MTRFDDAAITYWREHPAEFIEQVLINPETGRPFVLLDAEHEFLKHAFTLGPDGRLLYPTLIYSAIKKSGKTTFAAILVITVLLLFGGRFGEAYCLANDQEQSRGRVFEAIKRIVVASPILAHEADIITNKISFPATGSTITALASDYTGAAGCNPTISVFDELWGFTSENAWRLWDEFVPSPARQISCRLVVTHAGFSGKSELLEKLYQRGLEQPLLDQDLNAGNGMLMHWAHQPIAPWQTEAWLQEMRASLRPNQYLRMIENRFVTGEEAFVSLAEWDACCTARPVIADRNLPVWGAVDASVKRDSTAIVAVTWDRDIKKVRFVNHRIFHPSARNPINFADVEQTILDFKRRFSLRAVRYDPYQMASTAERLTKAGVRMEEFPQSLSNLTASSQNLYELVKGGGLIAYPDAEIRTAISRAVAVEGARGWKLTEEKTSHKIDVVVALAMAALAAVRKGEVGQMRWGTYGYGGQVHWKDPEPKERPRIKFVRVDERGNPITAEEAQALRHWRAR